MRKLMQWKWMRMTGGICVTGLCLVAYAQQPLFVPAETDRQPPVRLLPSIEEEPSSPTTSNYHQPQRYTPNADAEDAAELTPAAENVIANRPADLSFPRRRPLLNSASPVDTSVYGERQTATRTSERFSSLIDRLRTPQSSPTKSSSNIRTVSDTDEPLQIFPESAIPTPDEIPRVPVHDLPQHGAPVTNEFYLPKGMPQDGLLPTEQPTEMGHSFLQQNSGPPPVVKGPPIALESLTTPYVPSNTDPDALPWMGPYDERAAYTPPHEELPFPSTVIAEIPPGFAPWWENELRNPLRHSDQLLPVDVEVLTIGALQYAPQVLALKTEPHIRNTYMWEENAAFDWKLFIESKWQDINEPVGNTLTTNADRFRNDILREKAGVKRKNQLGGEFEIFQDLGYESQNSQFFIPKYQGTSRLQLSYTQPLLNGAGTAYNRSRIVLAQIESNRAFDEVAEELQDHLMLVAEAYWELYRARCAFLQRHKVLVTGEEILNLLSGRTEVDALQRQVLRARAAVAGRRAGIIRAAASIRNAESRLRLLVNDPRLLETPNLELIPIECPRGDYVPINMSGSLQSALMYRPEISQAIRDLRTSGVRVGMAEHELLPKLDLILETYTRGLAKRGNISSAFGKQFSDGRPSYSVGLEFEVPLGNRAATARLSRRQGELNKAVFEFRTVVETGLTAVELAVREAETAYREMLSEYQSLVAAQTEASYLEDRWRWLPGDRSTTLLLEDLLDAQERLAETEASLVEAQVNYTLSLIRIRRETGMLLQTEEQLAVVERPAGAALAEPVPTQYTPTP